MDRPAVLRASSDSYHGETVNRDADCASGECRCKSRVRTRFPGSLWEAR